MHTFVIKTLLAAQYLTFALSKLPITGKPNNAVFAAPF